MPWVIFSRRWLPVTVLVLAGGLLCVRLGIWQLDRLSQRRALNARIEYATSLPPVILPSAEDLTQQEYRSVRAQGFLDFDRQVALRNQVRAGEYGFHLLTPLRLQNGEDVDGAHVVLVDRGWIPAEGNQSPEAWHKYDLPGKVSIAGVIRLGRNPGGARPDEMATPAADAPAGRFALVVDAAWFSKQVGYPLPAFYVQAESDKPGTLPAGEVPSLDLGDGPHLGYAIQWFGFALVLAAGYGRHVRKQEEVGS
jgi:surfeit locus 1 family protein